jgi:hypothetical protein
MAHFHMNQYHTPPSAEPVMGLDENPLPSFVLVHCCAYSPSDMAGARAKPRLSAMHHTVLNAARALFWGR